MLADAQRDGRPAEYRWHLCARSKIPSGGKSPQKCIYSVPAQETAKDCSKFGWPPVSNVAGIMKPRLEIGYNLLGCPKLVNRSQPLVGRSLPYCENAWRRYFCLTSFFLIVDTCLTYEDTDRQSCVMVPRCRIFGDFLHSVFQLDYGCIVYGSACRSYLQTLDPIQNSALRLCLGAHRTFPSCSLCVLANEPPLYIRR